LPLAYALTYFCDAMLYLAALGLFGWLRGRGAAFYFVPVLLSVGCWLCGRTMKRGKLRWSGLATIIPCLFLAASARSMVAALPMMVYLPLYVYNNRFVQDYYYAAERFRYSLIIVGIILIFSLAVNAEGWQQGLPFLFLYASLSITLLRLLRHDDRMAQSRRFRVLNMAEVVLVCAIGFAASQPEILRMLRGTWLWFAEHVLLNLVALILYIIQWVLFAAAWLFNRIFGDMNADLEHMPNIAPVEAGQPALAQTADSIQALPLLLRLAIQGIGIAVLAVLGFMLLRALSGRIGRIEQVGGNDHREALSEKETPGSGRFRSRDRVDGVRRQYRQALMALRAKGGHITPTMNTLQIQRDNGHIADPEALDSLRNVYLPVRYGGYRPTLQDQKLARAAVERIRRSEVTAEIGIEREDK
jgi:hypothetical protein